MELSIPELRERIKHVAEKSFEDEVKALPIEEIIGEIIDIDLGDSAISIFDVKPETRFCKERNRPWASFVRTGQFMAVAVINDDLALTAKSSIRFTRFRQTGGPRGSESEGGT